jgi:hypothetical protein
MVTADTAIPFSRLNGITAYNTKVSKLVIEWFNALPMSTKNWSGTPYTLA